MDPTLKIRNLSRPYTWLQYRAGSNHRVSRSLSAHMRGTGRKVMRTAQQEIRSAVYALFTALTRAPDATELQESWGSGWRGNLVNFERARARRKYGAKPAGPCDSIVLGVYAFGILFWDCVEGLRLEIWGRWELVLCSGRWTSDLMESIIKISLKLLRW